MFPDTERFRWFEDHARRVIGRCKRAPRRAPNFSEEAATVYVPGGDDKYPSFWIRDAAMQCRSGLIDGAAMENMLKVILSFQNGPEWRPLASGLRVDPWAIPDHINLPGLGNEEFQRTFPPGACFFPGTYSPTENQGDGSYGLRAAGDDIYEVVELARLVLDSREKNEAAQFLKTAVKEIPVIERLDNGMRAMTIDKETGLCLNRPTDWCASSFHDGLRPMGKIALTSCLRFRAARTMARFFNLLGQTPGEEEYLDVAERISRSVVEHLLLSDGWIMLGSEVDRQPDVWSTSMAVYYGVLPNNEARQACEAMFRTYRDGTVAASGYLRHTPTTADVIPGKQVWEHGDGGSWGGQYGTYQAGGYWPQPLGYYAYALNKVAPDAARDIAVEFIEHTRGLANDGAPFEWINPVIPLEETPGLGRWYGPSAALPLEGFRRLSRGRDSR